MEVCSNKALGVTATAAAATPHVLATKNWLNDHRHPPPIRTPHQNKTQGESSPTGRHDAGVVQYSEYVFSDKQKTNGQALHSLCLRTTTTHAATFHHTMKHKPQRRYNMGVRSLTPQTRS